uniref:Uncharacterized protein n=1 Tax=Arundo donax TaxID=35708 RepID=A0A0A8YQF4_ARUDO
MDPRGTVERRWNEDNPQCRLSWGVRDDGRER